MPRQRTDDDIHRARLVYLGPPGYPFPVHLPYAQYGVFVVICAALTALSRVVTGGWGSVPVAIGLSLPLTSLIFKHVNPDRSARAVVKTVILDARRTPAADPAPLPSRSATHVRIGGQP